MPAILVRKTGHGSLKKATAPALVNKKESASESSSCADEEIVQDTKASEKRLSLYDGGYFISCFVVLSRVSVIELVVVLVSMNLKQAGRYPFVPELLHPRSCIRFSPPLHYAFVRKHFDSAL